MQVAYAIGVAEPVSVMVDTFGTGKVAEPRCSRQIVRRHFDFTPAGIIKYLELRRPIYRKTAAYGHFGRREPDFTWERTEPREGPARRRGRVVPARRQTRARPDVPAAGADD